jgi:hypothetical protein
MARIDDVTVTLRAVDKVSPALRRLSRRLWWFQYGGAILFAVSLLLMGVVTALAFALGRITA